MAGGYRSRWVRRRALAVAGGYLALAWGCVLYAWLDRGTYSLNFLIPFLATAPTSLLVVAIASALGLQQGSPGTVAVVLAGCGLAQATAVYALFGRRSAEPNAATDGGGR